MAWDPTTPATGATLLSEPVRSNFAALDTALMAPIVAAPPQALVKVGAGDVLEGLAPGPDGHVTTMVSGAPAWAAPAGVANGGGVQTIQALTQAAYDALAPKVATTLYVITT